MKHLAKKLLGAIRELIFGLEDGLVSTLGAVVGVAAGTSESKIVVLTGAVIIVVESLSMAAGSYLSSKSHREFLEKKISDERKEIEEKPEEETEELRAMYRKRGFSEDEVGILINRITQDKELWLEEMITKELHIGKIQLDELSGHATIMGLAYIIAGSVPVIPYLLLPVHVATIVAVISTVFMLFLLGYWKGIVTGVSKIRSGLEMMLIASVAAGIGYAIGSVIGNIFGLGV